MTDEYCAEPRAIVGSDQQARAGGCCGKERAQPECGGDAWGGSIEQRDDEGEEKTDADKASPIAHLQRGLVAPPDQEVPKNIRRAIADAAADHGPPGAHGGNEKDVEREVQERGNDPDADQRRNASVRQEHIRIFPSSEEAAGDPEQHHPLNDSGGRRVGGRVETTNNRQRIKGKEGK